MKHDDFDKDDEILEQDEFFVDNNHQANLIFEDFSDYIGDASLVLKKHLLCSMCGAHLNFSHITDYQHGLLQETARCPDCNIRTRTRLHKIQ
jgi:hypothetical protein